MKFCLIFLSLISNIFASVNVWGANYEKPNEIPYEKIFIQTMGSKSFSYIALISIVFVLACFLIHYMVVGAKKFKHNENKIYAFNTFERTFHFLAALSWIILLPTGLIMIFGNDINNGFILRSAKNLHLFGTCIFAISILPLLFFWSRRMLPALYDIKWLMICGGYLKKEITPIPAGKFNFGQKCWFYISIMGGLVMLLSGGVMFFIDYFGKLNNADEINLLSFMILLHNVLGIGCVLFFLVHIYMACFAIKGSIHAMITGYKEEQEVFILHNYWYQELRKTDKIPRSSLEGEHQNLRGKF